MCAADPTLPRITYFEPLHHNWLLCYLDLIKKSLRHVMQAASQAAAAAHPADSRAEAAAGGDAPQPKKEKKAKKEKAPAAPKAAEAEPTVDVLNIRVGRILSVELHPNADGLYVEQIDLGEGAPRQVGFNPGLRHAHGRGHTVMSDLPEVQA